MPVPQTLLTDLRAVPTDRPVALILRHSARFPILDDLSGETVGLTPEGFLMAEQFGALLAYRRPVGRLLSSPVGRCVDTARSIAKGGQFAQPVMVHEMLGHPFVGPVWDILEGGGPNGHVPAQVNDLVKLAISHRSDDPVLDLLVTHDSILAVLIHYLFQMPYRGSAHWPGFLEGIFFWKDVNRKHALWRGNHVSLEGKRIESVRKVQP
jgi:broad specificity phosphatase PhoE